MNYELLAEEYFSEANVLKNHIKSLKHQYCGTKNGANTIVKDRISTLYKIYLELIHTGRYLKRKQELIERCKK